MRATKQMEKGEEKDSLAMVGEESRKLLGAPDAAWPLRKPVGSLRSGAKACQPGVQAL